MNKKVFNWMLAAALVFGLGITVTSCKDDNEENKSEAQKEQEAQEKASKFWNVVGQLVSVDDVTDDYEGKTFEPTYGLPDPTNSVTRIVNTNDMKTAAQRFANLVNAKGIDENTPSHTWRDPEIGTMTYTRGGDAANWATVDVDIKAVPGLQRIIYREGGEGTNGKFSGKAYYRFGDVVSRQVNITYDQKKNNDDRRAITEYWICVRPAFGPEGKEDSHWVCVNTVSDKNYKYYKASTGTDYWLPTNLKTDKENMQNFAELLWAICYPDEWYKNVDEHHRDGTLWGFDGVPFFTDFKKANLELHNQYFWQNVQDGWNRKQIAEQAMNIPFNTLSKEISGSGGLHLLYSGYSWIFMTSWDCETYEAVYTNGKAEEELNMHHVDFLDWEKNMKELTLDVREMGQTVDNYKTYFNSDGKHRWTIRHATGKELATDKKSDVKKPITGVKEEYRYYRDAVEMSDLSGKPEITDKPQIQKYNSRAYFDLGDVVCDEDGNNWFCVQTSTKGNNMYGECPYDYFVSLDEGAVGTNLENIVQTQNLASQIMFDFILQFHNYIAGPDKPHSQGLKNIQKYCDINLEEIVAVRDSIVKHPGYQGESRELNTFMSTLIKDSSGDLIVLRYHDDCTVSQSNGLRDMMYWFQTQYTQTPTRTMLLNDLADQNIINSYNKDMWVYCKWYDFYNKKEITTNVGPRTTTEAAAPLSRFIYKKGSSVVKGTMPANIYKEPIIPFAVKRLKDDGKFVNKFEDGTMFTSVSEMKNVDPDTYGDDMTGHTIGVLFSSYDGYAGEKIFLNGQPYSFGMSN